MYSIGQDYYKSDRQEHATCGDMLEKVSLSVLLVRKVEQHSTYLVTRARCWETNRSNEFMFGRKEVLFGRKSGCRRKG